MDVPSLPARYVTMREIEIASRRERGQAMRMTYPQIKELLDPFYHTYECADGRPFYEQRSTGRICWELTHCASDRESGGETDCGGGGGAGPGRLGRRSKTPPIAEEP